MRGIEEGNNTSTLRDDFLHARVSADFSDNRVQTMEEAREHLVFRVTTVYFLQQSQRRTSTQ